MLTACSVLVAGLMAAASPPPAAAAADRFFQYLGFSPEEQEGLRRGEIVSHVVQELSDKELAVTMAVLVPTQLDKLLETARSGKELEINRDILSHGALGAGGAGDLDAAAFRDVGFGPSEGEEIRALFEVQAGSRFNLSQAELQRFADLRKRFRTNTCDKDAVCAEAVQSTLRDVLKSRLVAYRERGLSGIEPYARGAGKTSSPAAELRLATHGAQFLAKEYPGIFDAFLNYPGGDQTGIESRFLWLKQRIQDRPTLILAHRVMCVRDGMAFAAERQFYVGQSYNSLQITYGLAPRDGKTLVFYLNRTSTDQVAGFMSGARHSMGRKIMEKEVRRHFEAMVATVRETLAR